MRRRCNRWRKYKKRARGNCDVGESEAVGENEDKCKAESIKGASSKWRGEDWASRRLAERALREI